jgi:hypothetical protein
MKVQGLAEILCVAGAAALLAGCASRIRRVAMPAGPPRPALRASEEQLAERYEKQATAVQSLNAVVKLKAETGSAFSSVIREYRQISAFLLAERPAYLRVVGQAPVVGTDIFDMASNGTTFHMYIPSKRKFVVGPAQGGPEAKKPIENLRPEPICEALLWKKIAPDEPVMIEQEDAQQPPASYYVLSVLRRNGHGFALDRRIWFDRSNLRVSRVEIFGAEGRLESDIHYADWLERSGTTAFPGQIVLWQPHDHYRLEIDITRLSLNQKIPSGRFRLEQPAGTERVELGQGGGS